MKKRKEKEEGWRVLATYVSGFDADVAMAQLETAKIPAVRNNNDTVGIFGPGFQGATARGVTVLVPAGALEAAREAVTLVQGVGSPDTANDDET